MGNASRHRAPGEGGPGDPARWRPLMSNMPEQVAPGTPLTGRGGVRIGTVDAAYADYLLVRTAGLLPVDLYVPRPAVAHVDGGLTVDAGRADAYERWHRPLKRAPHD